MAKEKDDGNSYITDIWKTFKEVATSNLKESIKEKAQRVKKKLIAELFGFAFLMLGIVLVVVSLVFFINYYLQLNFTWSFLLVGILLILISMIVKNRRD